MKQNKGNESASVVSGILGFLRDRGKGDLIASVAAGLDTVVDSSRVVNKIIITSAIRLTDEQMRQIKKLVCKFLKREIPAVNRIDKETLGGFSIRVGDFYLDATLESELNLVKNALLS